MFAAFESGIGKEVLKFCEVFNMPFNMSPDTWYSHEETLSQAFQEETSEQLQKNCAEAGKLTMLEEGIDDDDVTTVDIPISLDGTWSKHGYTANHCIGFVISAATGKVLDFEVISKVCQQCTQMKAKLDKAVSMTGIKTISVKGPTEDPALAREWTVRRGFGGGVRTIMSDRNRRVVTVTLNHTVLYGMSYGACGTCYI